MPQLNTTISSDLWRSIADHADKTREPLADIVHKALAGYLQIPHHKLYKVSTGSAVVEGIYQGAIRVGTLREHGDFGLVAFENPLGEMVVINGHCFQVRSDGSVQECHDDVLSPFVVITRFEPEETVTLDHCPNVGHLIEQCDALRSSENFFFALKVNGRFDYVRTRALCRTAEGVPLVQAAAVQPEFELCNVSGTLVGFWTPEYAKKFNVPGYHFHFISDDRQSGGHLLQCRGTNLRLQLQREGEYHIALPETEAFLKAEQSEERWG